MYLNDGSVSCRVVAISGSSACPTGVCHVIYDDKLLVSILRGMTRTTWTTYKIEIQVTRPNVCHSHCVVPDLQRNSREQGCLEGSWVGRRPVHGRIDKRIDAYLVQPVVFPFRTKELHTSPIKVERHIRLWGIGDHVTALRVSGVFIAESSECASG